jgi:hypothetical protein
MTGLLGLVGDTGVGFGQGVTEWAGAEGWAGLPSLRLW